MPAIVFTDTFGVPEKYSPVPAYQMIPDWYKETESYVGGQKAPDGNGMMQGTIKRCMPVFDAFTAGYFLVLHTDLWVSQREQNPNEPGKKSPWFEWPSFSPIEFHSAEQAPLHPKVTQTSIPKWINPWSIKTPPGYSTLFTAPLHRDNQFVALPAVVDTDQYDAPVNIVFTLKDPDFEGLVPAGTPICQVVPFKRESWEMQIGTKDDLENQNKTTVKLRTKFFDSYKTQYRQVKEYK